MAEPDFLFTGMYQLIQGVSDILVKYMESQGEEVDMGDMFSRFSMDTISR